MSEGTKRIVWVDTAKGICILLVVLHHCAQVLDTSYPLQQEFMAFRMPLYFILSGLFFKQYGFKTFVLKKTNKLLIPYVFFYVVTGVLIPVILFRLWGLRLAFYESYGFKAVLSLFSERIICNPSIWFLFCLFEVNMLFYLLYFISQRCKHSNLILGILSFIVGMFGLFLAYKRIQLPYYFDSSCTVLPFFFFGFYLRNHTAFLTAENTKKSVFFSIAFIVITALLLHCFNYDRLSVIDNYAGDLRGCAQVYPYGIIGTMSVLLLSKMVGKLPALSYFGRYSLIVLCTHIYVLDLVNRIVRIGEGTSMRLLAVFLLTVIGCFIIIPIFKKYLACFTAQKDLIRVTD